jgi:hypothetical protein
MVLRTCATFESDSFNTTKSKPEFAHPDNYGDDLVRWLMGKLRDRGVSVDESGPSQEDHGWYVTFGSGRESHDAIVVYAPSETASRWLLSVERSVGVLGTIFGRRTRTVLEGAVELIHNILSESTEIRSVRWLRFEDVRQGDLDGGAPTPLGD